MGSGVGGEHGGEESSKEKKKENKSKQNKEKKKEKEKEKENNRDYSYSLLHLTRSKMALPPPRNPHIGPYFCRTTKTCCRCAGGNAASSAGDIVRHFCTRARALGSS